MAKSILIIDDDRLVLKSLKRLLENEGYVIFCAENSKEAIGCINQTELDLIISDIRMPEVNGIELVHNVRDILNEKKQKSVPIIFITGYSDENSYNEAQEMNASDFIYKPFEKDKFLLSIKLALGNK
jgi:DNA-binding NtrC family response regulator